MKSSAILLSDGTIIPAESIGHNSITVGEIVFNTSMTGYQEIITDPSYNKQIVTFTNPHIGNTGINLDDYESGDHGCSGIIIRNKPTKGSSWRSENKFIEFLKDKSISAVCSLDTRYLTLLLREKGSINGCIVPDIKKLNQAKALLSDFPGLNGLDLAKNVTAKKQYSWNEGTHDLINIESSKNLKKLKVFAYDYGIKKNILRILCDLGCDVTVVPADTPYNELLKNDPDGMALEILLHVIMQ